MKCRRFTNQESGFGGVVPEGWREREPGQFGRGVSEADPTFLVQLGVPGATVDLVTQLLLPKIGLHALPPSAGRLENGHLGWDLYAVERENPDAGPTRMDLALAQSDAGAYVILFGATPKEYDALHYQVFMRVVDALTPLAARENRPGLCCSAAILNEPLPAAAVPPDNFRHRSGAAAGRPALP